MNTKYYIAGLAVLTISMHVGAAGFSSYTNSASAIGRSFAGEGAIGDNASVIAFNPASMSLLDDPELSIVGAYLDPYHAITGGTSSASSNFLTPNVRPSSALGSVYFVLPLDVKSTIGFGIFSNFHQRTLYPDSYDFGYLGRKTNLDTYNINPSYAYQLYRFLTLGIGYNLVYESYERTANYGITDTSQASAVVRQIRGTGWGQGWNAGVLFEPFKNHRWALSYRSRVNVSLDGNYIDNENSISVAPSKVRSPLPSILDFSGYNQLYPDWAVHYSATFTKWSTYNDRYLFINGAKSSIVDEHLQDSWRFALGATHALSDRLDVRFGIAYNEAATRRQDIIQTVALVPDTQIAMPDANRIWLSIGGTYYFWNNHNVDLGIAYSRYTTKPDAVQTTSRPFNLVADDKAFRFALQWNKVF